MVDLAVVASRETARFGAAAIASVADHALGGGRQTPAASEVERSRGMVLEDRQIVDGFAGHPNQIAHRQATGPAGPRRRRHRDALVDGGFRGLLQFGQRCRHHDRDGCAAVLPEPAGGHRGLHSEFERVMASLLGASPVPFRIAVGLVSPRAHHSGRRLQIGAGLGVQPTGQPTHTVGPLGAEHQAAATGAVLVGEVAVGIKAIGDDRSDGRDELGVLLAGVADQGALGLLPVGCGH